MMWSKLRKSVPAPGPEAAATRLLGEKDDNFLRIRPQCRNVAARLADYVVTERKVRKVGVIYDVSNAAYTTDWKNCFKKRLESIGGEIVADLAFDSLGQHRFAELVKQTREENPEGILLLANSLDTAMLTQQMMKQDIKLPIFASEWSMTRDLLSSGGRSVDGMAMFHVFNESSQKQSYLDFKKKVRQRFKQEISFPLVHAYDATRIVGHDSGHHSALPRRSATSRNLFHTHPQ